jgi:hypothetical protein
LSLPLWGQDCPPGATPVRVERAGDEVRTYCKCQKGYVAREGSCVPAPPPVIESNPVPNLALNPHLAQVDLLELREVQARMARLHKALDILQETDREASKEWKALHAEMVDQSREIQWQAFLFMTAGLGEVLKLASADNLRQSEAMLHHEIWTELPVEKAKLQSLLASTHGKDAEILKQVIDSFDRVDRARQMKDSVETGNRLRELMVVEIDTMKRLSPREADPRTVNVLYESSAFMGRTAIVFGKGVVEKSAAVASFAEPFAEASAVYLMMEQEERQFKELSSQSADRQTKRRQIHEQLGELENRQQSLQWAVQRADPSVKIGTK